MLSDWLQEKLDTMSDEGRAEVAAYCLNESDPNADFFATMFSNLNDGVKGELVSRAADLPDEE